MGGGETRPAAQQVRQRSEHKDAPTRCPFLLEALNRGLMMMLLSGDLWSVDNILKQLMYHKNVIRQLDFTYFNHLKTQCVKFGHLIFILEKA